MRTPPEKRSGFGDAAGRAALYPARVAARAWRGRLESAADDVLAAPETARVVDQALAGQLPEKLAQSLVQHRVLERIVGELAESGELEKLVKQALDSPHTRDILDEVMKSDEMQRALRDVMSSPEVRHAISRQTAGLVEEVVAGVRHAAVRADGRVGRTLDRADAHKYAGIGSRAVALAIDAFIAVLIFTSGSAIVGLIGSLVGGIRPHWLVGTLLGIGLLVVAFVYFALFWSSAGQTPGMRLMRLRVQSADGGGLSVLRALVRVIGLGLAIIPFFAGFIPVLFDHRRRGLPDYLAGTVVVYDAVREP